MKAINYKMKIEYVRLVFQRKPSRPAIIQNKSYVYKRTSNMTKIKN